MNEEQKHQSNHRGIAICSILCILYVLSIGPVGAAAEKGRISAPTLKILRFAYSPITWLHDHTIFEKPLDVYTELWGF